MYSVWIIIPVRTCSVNIQNLFCEKMFQTAPVYVWYSNNHNLNISSPGMCSIYGCSWKSSKLCLMWFASKLCKIYSKMTTIGLKLSKNTIWPKNVYAVKFLSLGTIQGQWLLAPSWLLWWLWSECFLNTWTRSWKSRSKATWLNSCSDVSS